MAFSYDRKPSAAGEAGAHGAGRAPQGAQDPLAELARLVGEDDPFAVFDEGQGHAARSQAAHPGHEAAHPGYEAHAGAHAHHDPAHHDPAGGYEGGYDPHAYAPQAHAPQAHDPDAYAAGHAPYYDEPHPGEPEGAAYADGHAGGHDDAVYYADAGYDDDRYADPYMGEGAHDAVYAAEMPVEDEPAPRAAPARRSGGYVLLGAVMGLALLGGGATVAYQSLFATAGSGGPPPVIEASTDPVRVEPDDPGGAQVPHQNKLIYDRLGGGGPVTEEVNLVPAEEEDIASIPGRSERGDLSADRPIEPRRVRTVVVRPDGTIVRDPGEESSAAEPAPAERQVASLAQGGPGMGGADDADQARALMGRTGNEAGSAGPAGTEDMPADGDETAAIAPSTEATNAAPAGTEAAPAAAEASGIEGDWAVQLSAQRSEDGARSAFENLQGSHPSLLGDRQPVISRADLGERGVYYRLRVAENTREGATRLCESLKAAGGDCIVQRN